MLESLTQPLEDGIVAIARVRGHALFPARFQLIGTINLQSAALLFAPIPLAVTG